MTSPRFLTVDEIAEELAASHTKMLALVKRGELRAIQLGGRGQWRVARTTTEQYIADPYASTDQWIAAHPFVGEVDED